MQENKTYSKEYIEYAKLENTEPSFSIMEVYKTLENDYSAEYKCDGFGFNYILKHENECKLIFNTEKQNFLVNYSDLMVYMRIKNK